MEGPPAGMPAGIAGGRLIVSAKYGSIAQTMPVPFAKSCAACARGTPTSSTLNSRKMTFRLA
jgi:hypothetical protein